MDLRIAMVDPSAFTIPYDTHLCDALIEQGHQVTLYGRPYRREESHVGESDYYQAQFHRGAEWLRRAGAPGFLCTVVKGFEHGLSLAALWNRLRRDKPDVIHFQWVVLPVVDNFMLGRMRSIAPLVLTVHDTEPFCGAPSSAMQTLGWKNNLDRFDRLIVHSAYSRDSLLAIGVSADKMEVIPHGVMRLPGKSPFDVRTAPSQPRNVVLFGAMKAYKGVDVLLDAFAALNAKLRATVNLRISGACFLDSDQLVAQCKSLGISDQVCWDMRFLGDDDVHELCRNADLFVFPYRRIDSSGALMLVLPYARPIVATTVGGFADILTDGENAILVPPEDPRALAQALERVLTQTSTAETLGRANLQLSEGILNWHSIATHTSSLYRSLL